MNVLLFFSSDSPSWTKHSVRRKGVTLIISERVFDVFVHHLHFLCELSGENEISVLQLAWTLALALFGPGISPLLESCWISKPVEELYNNPILLHFSPHPDLKNSKGPHMILDRTHLNFQYWTSTGFPLQISAERERERCRET